MEHDYNWINDTVERTLDYYRKRRSLLVVNGMEQAAAVIQKAYRRYKGWKALPQNRIKTHCNRKMFDTKTMLKNYQTITSKMTNGDNGAHVTMDWRDLEWQNLDMDNIPNEMRQLPTTLKRER